MFRMLAITLLVLLAALPAFAQRDWRDDRLPYYSGNKQLMLQDNTTEPAPTYGAACVNQCLARGTMPDVCDEECGMVRDEGVFYDSGYDPRQVQPKRNVGSGFEGVDYECFRQCRLHGDSFETCSTMCGR